MIMKGCSGKAKKLKTICSGGHAPSKWRFPVFIPAILGCKIRVLPDNVMGEEQELSWEEALEKTTGSVTIPGSRNTWNSLEALVDRAEGRYPVSHGAELGPTDLHALLRGHQ